MRAVAGFAEPGELGFRSDAVDRFLGDAARVDGAAPWLALVKFVVSCLYKVHINDLKQRLFFSAGRRVRACEAVPGPGALPHLGEGRGGAGRVLVIR